MNILLGATVGVAICFFTGIASASDNLTQYVLAVYGNGRFGSGVAISESRVATSCHTLQGASRVGVTNRDTTIRAATDKGAGRGGKDICLLHFDVPHGFPVPTIGSSKNLKPGQQAIALGYANGQLTTVRGPVVGTQEQAAGGAVIHTNTPVTAGTSGGPLFDAGGSLIGIITYIQMDSRGTHLGAFSVPVEWAVELNHINPYAVWALYQGGEFWKSAR